MSAQTTYIVFRRDGENLSEVGRTAAATPKAAITQTVERLAKETGEPVKGNFAACPFRNWSEFPVGVEVVTRVKVG